MKLYLDSYGKYGVCAWVLLLTVCAVTWAENESPIQVIHEGAIWTITGSRQQVFFDENSFKMEIKTPGARWQTVESSVEDLQVKSGTDTIALALRSAADRQIEPYRTGYQSGIKITLSQFPHPSQENRFLDIKLQLMIGLLHLDEELVCEMIPQEGQDAILQMRWPREFEPASIDATIVPFMQGMYLPRDWPRATWLYDTESYGRGLYMPWWGYQQGKNAAVVILETPSDGGCHFAHPAGGPTRMGIRWIHSLGKMAYPRRARVCFLEDSNYVDMAKRYRRFTMDTGHFVSLKEKVARSPLLEKLIGSPVIHTHILYHIQPQSDYYDKENPQMNHQLVTFAERAQHLQKLAQRGVRRAYVHLDGWGKRGYDNLHPDILPPCEEAGGWEGMKQLAETCEQCNFVFAIHDQYRDYYEDSESYDPRHTLIDFSGNRPFHSVWFGGKQSILCSRLAPRFVERNHRALIEHGVKVRGAYLDVFAVVPPDECYNPEHPVTRRECLQYRGECFSLVRRNLGIVSSEEPADWAIPHLDLVHHGPFALDPNPGKGPAMGIPIPLFNLVYHDALLLPWSLGKGEWGIPESDWGYLHALMNAGLPYLSLEPDEETINKVKALCALHERVGLLEMTRHEFLDASYRKQRTTYADGTSVTVDLDTQDYSIQPALEKKPSAFDE